MINRKETGKKIMDREKTRPAGLIMLVLILAWSIIAPAALCKAAVLTEGEKLEVFLDGILASQFAEHNIPGAILAVVKDGEIIFSRGYGFSDVQARIPMDPERSLFRPGSVSKLFTWTALMQLWEQGKVDLDSDINNYLNFTIPQGPGRKQEPITVRHLMTHTPGFEDRGEGLFVLGEENMLGLDEYLRKYLPERVFPAGEILAYSNYGSALAGYIVEQVSGQSFSEYVEENIFTPLGMENSTFRQPLPEHLTSDMTRAYKYQGGEYHEGEFEFISAYPAGAMSTTALDLARFMIAHLQQGSYGGVEILQPETVRKMHSQQFTHHPEIPGMTLGFIEVCKNGEQILAHTGATFLFYSGMYLLPEHDLGLFVSYSGGTGSEQEKLFHAFMGSFFPEEYVDLPEPDREARERALAYQGEYHPSRSNFTSFEKVLGIFQRVTVDVNEEGYLVLKQAGQAMQFAEDKPGVYVPRHQTWMIDNIAFIDDGDGETMLFPGGPMSFSQVPWYGASSLLGGVMIIGMVIILGTFLFWTVSFFRKLVRREYKRDHWEARVARLIVVTFALLLLFFVFGLAGIFGSIDPAYGVPEIMFGEVPPIMDLLMFLPLFLAILGLAMMVFSVLSWWKRYWTLRGRLHYSLITLSVLGLLWVLSYTNFL